MLLSKVIVGLALGLLDLLGAWHDVYPDELLLPTALSLHCPSTHLKMIPLRRLIDLLTRLGLLLGERHWRRSLAALV